MDDEGLTLQQFDTATGTCLTISNTNSSFLSSFSSSSTQFSSCSFLQNNNPSNSTSNSANQQNHSVNNKNNNTRNEEINNSNNFDNNISMVNNSMVIDPDKYSGTPSTMDYQQLPQIKSSLPSMHLTNSRRANRLKSSKVQPSSKNTITESQTIKSKDTKVTDTCTSSSTTTPSLYSLTSSLLSLSCQAYSCIILPVTHSRQVKKSTPFSQKFRSSQESFNKESFTQNSEKTSSRTKSSSQKFSSQKLSFSQKTSSSSCSHSPPPSNSSSSQISLFSFPLTLTRLLCLFSIFATRSSCLANSKENSNPFTVTDEQLNMAAYPVFNNEHMSAEKKQHFADFTKAFNENLKKSIQL
jgi:hypothetical protein